MEKEAKKAKKTIKQKIKEQEKKRNALQKKYMAHGKICDRLEKKLSKEQIKNDKISDVLQDAEEKLADLYGRRDE